ncbi:squalene/phytoene synthase family protein [Streptomyces chartreusis]|uniref:squalene/phytoene synthase family protein n=1 Tax=Streptomyces chartreusis TaxID=1969 RepID=UPI00380CD6DD
MITALWDAARTTVWENILTQAGIIAPVLRDDYTQAAAYVRDLEPHAHAGIRLCVPPALQPHLLASTAFSLHTDTVFDAPPTPDSKKELAHWLTHVRQGLTHHACPYPLLRAYRHTLASHGLDATWMLRLADAADTGQSDLR